MDQISGSSGEVSKRRRLRGKVMCEHCNQLLPKSTYYRHKDTFYNFVSRKWQRVDEVEARSQFSGKLSAAEVCTDSSSDSGTSDSDGMLGQHTVHDYPEGMYSNVYSAGSLSTNIT